MTGLGSNEDVQSVQLVQRQARELDYQLILHRHPSGQRLTYRVLVAPVAFPTRTEFAAEGRSALQAASLGFEKVRELGTAHAGSS
jgi:hypothetical protein